ncbi:hypothetical protein PFISCL1PPCAC_9985, partial [Pristionchus fissidentatus]
LANNEHSFVFPFLGFLSLLFLRMGNHLSQTRQRLSKRNSLPASAFSSSYHPIPPSSRLSYQQISSQNSGGEQEDEPVNEKLVMRLKDIDGEVRNSRDKGLDSLGLDKVHVGFVGFCGSGKTTLIRSILGCPVNTETNGAKDKRSTFKKSRSVHFSETVSTQLVPYYFRHLSSIVLWEISYPFEVLVSTGDQRMERRDEKLRAFFVEQHLNKFCLLFLCIDREDPREEDLAFARAARVHGKEVIFLRTKVDSLLDDISSQREASSLIARERIIFETKLASIASDLADLQTFFVSSKSIPSLISESSDAQIAAFRQMEFIPDRSRQIDAEEGRRHTMEGSTVETMVSDSPSILKLEEEQLMRFIVDQIDEFPLNQ